MNLNIFCDYKLNNKSSYYKMCLKYVDFFKNNSSENVKYCLTGNAYYDEFMIDLNNILYNNKNKELTNKEKIQNFKTEISKMKENISCESSKFGNIYMFFTELIKEIDKII